MVPAADNGDMFLTDCLECGLRELRGARSIETLVSTDHGIDARLPLPRCATVNLLSRDRLDRRAGARTPSAA